ncbi:hypothetical protein NHQ30_005008 [Ciborinia camelliae]|nr:hypothetical protein NHQ30_005008 [Ciborinia camelliae]
MTPQIAFRIHNNSLTARKRLFEQRIARRERDAIIATFDDEIDGREHRLHARKTGCMMPQIIGAGERELLGEHGAGDELGHVDGWFLDVTGGAWQVNGKSVAGDIFGLICYGGELEASNGNMEADEAEG